MTWQVGGAAQLYLRWKPPCQCPLGRWAPLRSWSSCAWTGTGTRLGEVPTEALEETRPPGAAALWEPAPGPTRCAPRPVGRSLQHLFLNSSGLEQVGAGEEGEGRQAGHVGPERADCACLRAQVWATDQAECCATGSREGAALRPGEAGAPQGLWGYLYLHMLWAGLLL